MREHGSMLLYVHRTFGSLAMPVSVCVRQGSQTRTVSLTRLTFPQTPSTGLHPSVLESHPRGVTVPLPCRFLFVVSGQPDAGCVVSHRFSYSLAMPLSVCD